MATCPADFPSFSELGSLKLVGRMVELMASQGTELRTGTGLGGLFRRAWQTVRRAFLPFRAHAPARAASTPADSWVPLRRVRLTDGVGRTLFEEYAAHRAEDRGNEETGWVLMGLRQRDEALALATLPAGALRDAGRAHVQFNSAGQALGSRIVRQTDRRLTILGVVHTHPGSLRHPSEGDFEGDSAWVRRLRGGEGVFGIGTVDGDGSELPIAAQPRPHVQSFGDLSFSWYSLGTGERDYRPLPVDLTLGPDLARPLHSVWSTVERHAEPLDRLYRQQVGVRCEVVHGQCGPSLAVVVPLAERDECLRVLLREDEAEFLLVKGSDVFAVDRPAQRIDQAVYLLLAELALRA